MPLPFWIRVFLPGFLIVYLLVCFGLRIWIVRRQIGAHPVVVSPDGETAYDFIGTLIKIVIGSAAGVVSIAAFAPEAYTFLAPLRYLQTTGLQITGLGLLLASFVWTVVAQSEMGELWRIGLDPSSPKRFVESGVFRLSRNPIYLGMTATLISLFLLLPNALTLAICAVGLSMFNVQIRLEEAFLIERHGESYIAFMRRVRRWI